MISRFIGQVISKIVAVKNGIVNHLCCNVQYLERMRASACSDAAQRVMGAVLCHGGVGKDGLVISSLASIFG